MSRGERTHVDLAERTLPRSVPRVQALVWVSPPSVAGRVTSLAREVSVGRAESCNARLDCDDVSRLHATLSLEGPTLLVHDCRSTNGTFVDGRRVARARLREGSVLRLGSCVGVVRAEPARDAGFGPIAGGVWGGAELRRVLAPARAAAASRLPVLFVGEAGSGKQVCARAIHEWSARSGRFVSVNCAALTAERAEAELLGYRRGAFGSALHDSPGYLRSAHGGTLLLDALEQLPLETQASLLRALQEQAVTPLGHTDREPIDVRIVCASRLPLARAVTAGTLRGDLLMRLKGLQLELPPLRGRRADVAFLFRHFLAATGASPEPDARVIEALCMYTWPGNVRELELVARRLLATCAGQPRLELEHLPLDLQPAPAPAQPSADPARAELERLASRLLGNGADLNRACAELGISRQRAYHLLGGRSVRELLAELGR